jgi:hypothetical protein
VFAGRVALCDVKTITLHAAARIHRTMVSAVLPPGGSLECARALRHRRAAANAAVVGASMVADTKVQWT